MASGWLAAKAGEARRPPVEPWSLAAYGVALGVWLLVALGFAITRFDSDGSLTRFHVQVAALVLPAMGLRYLSFPRLATAIEAMAVKMTISAGFAFASVILAATNRPLVDAMLHRWDLAIGFDWRTAMAMLQPHGGAIAALHWIYATLPYQMFLVVPLAAFFGQERRIWVFVAAWGLQWGIGEILDLFPGAAEGVSDQAGYRWAFGLALLSQFAAFGWYMRAFRRKTPAE